MADALLVAAMPCEVSSLRRFFEHGNWEVVIAIDRGYETLREAGIHPTLALGDFDSLGYVPDDVPVERHSPIKDASDMELAFSSLAQWDIETVYLFGALGGRLDHTLANLSVFAKASEEGLRIIVAGDDQALAVVTGPATFSLPPAAQGVVSVMALNDVVEDVSETGLYYPLDHATLTNRTSLGLSNELIGESVTISLRRGTLAIFYPIEMLLGY